MSLAAPPRQARGSGDNGSRRRSYGGGGGGGWTLLIVARNGVIAHLIGGLLQEEGIDFVLDTSNSSPGAWLHPFGDPTAPVRVMVRERDLALAGALIAYNENSSSGPTKDGATHGRGTARAALLVTLTIALILAFVEVVGFAPCFLRLFCF